MSNQNYCELCEKVVELDNSVELSTGELVCQYCADRQEAHAEMDAEDREISLAKDESRFRD